jgi:hypothetical protein
MKKFYRYDAVQYVEHDDYGELCSAKYPNPEVVLSIYSLFKETPKGYWIGYGELQRLHSASRWVSKTARKRFAYPTKEEALESFIKRNEKRIKILKHLIEHCEIAVMKGKKMKIKELSL